MEAPKQSPDRRRRYWWRVFARAFRETNQIIVPHKLEKVVELLSIPIAIGILSWFKLRELGFDHFRWEMAILAAAIVLYFPIWLYKVATVPAAMDRESAQHSAELSKEITRLQPKPSPTEARRRASVKDKIDKLTSSEHEIIGDILSQGSCQWFIAGMDRPDPWSNLENIGLVIKERGGRCVLRSEVADDVKAIFDEEF